MEESLVRLRRLWNILRFISIGLIAAVSVLALLAFPSRWLVAAIPFALLGVVAAILAVTQWERPWVWLALIILAGLFSLGLFAAVFGLNSEGSVPLLLLVFAMILASEHVLSSTLSYSSQFSDRRDAAIRIFNADTLTASLKHLYRRLARDGLILGAGFVLSVAAASVGILGPTVPILSDPSLYMVIASISLAALVILKEE